MIETPNVKMNLTDKGQTKKMILVARDYVHYLRKRERSLLEKTNSADYAKVDGVSIAIPTLPQLLSSLKDDLRCATTIFMEEFIECGGVECLLDVLRLNLSLQNQVTSSPTKAKQQQMSMRKNLTEQLDCLLCLKYATKSTKSLKRIADVSHGVSTISACIMTGSTKLRIIVLELLCRIANSCTRGHGLILEALTANRVLFGEPVRFKFLVGMLNGCIADKPTFQTAALKFLNSVLRTCPKTAERIRLQCELEEAGFNVGNLEEALLAKSIPQTDIIWEEITAWKKSYLDMENVNGQKQNLESENEKLHKEVQMLRKALQKLEEDKINLMQIEMELKEKCEDLNDEVSTLKNEIKQVKISEGVSKTFRHFGQDDDDFFPSSGDSGQLEMEEILIDVPTIRPPLEFCNTDGSYNSLPTRTGKFTTVIDSTDDDDIDRSKHLHENDIFRIGQQQQNCPTTGKNQPPSTNSSDKESADSALSESESDSGINWNYPVIPEAPTIIRTGRSRNRSIDDMSPGQIFRSPKRNSNAKLQRSKSEDRRDSYDMATTITANRTASDGETKVADSSGFILKKRPEKDRAGRTSSLPIRETPSFTRYPVTPSYQLPVAYRSNFLTRGHSNCDLYSGIKEQDMVPSIPDPDYSGGYSVANSGGTISAMVHREITKAVRQITGWI